MAGFDLNALFQQAQQIQEQMKRAQEELARKEVTGTAGGGMVTVTANGRGELLKVQIDPKVVDPKDVAMLEDLGLAAGNSALRAAQQPAQDPCAVCADPQRDAKMICVVESVPDLLAVERTREFRGRYHVLHGALSPLDGVGPDQLKLKELLARLHGDVQEVIVATDPTVEGEATALYLTRLIKPLGVPVTRIPQRMPMAGALEHADQVTLPRALQGRREL